MDKADDEVVLYNTIEEVVCAGKMSVLWESQLVGYVEQFASKHTSAEVVDLLCNVGKSTAEQNNKLLARASSPSLVQALLDLGVDPNPKGKIPRFYTVATDAAAELLRPMTQFKDRGELIELLSERARFVFMSRERDYTLASVCNNGLAVRELARVGVNIDARSSLNGRSALFITGSYDATRALVELGADPFLIDQCKCNALHHNTNADRVRYLIDVGVNINQKDHQGRTPLHTAMSGGVVHALVDAGADLEARDLHGSTPMHTVRSLDVLQALVKRGGSIAVRNSFLQTPLHSVFDDDMSNYLLSIGADVNAQDKKGRTPLFTRMYLKESNLKAFIDAGADVSATTNKGESLLQHIQHDQEGFNALLDHGCPATIRDVNGNTTLHIYARSCLSHHELERLLAGGVDIDATNRHGKTALHVAAKWDPNRVGWFLDNGADPSIRSNSGLLPIDEINATDHPDAYSLLSDALCKRQREAIQQALGTEERSALRRRM